MIEAVPGATSKPRASHRPPRRRRSGGSDPVAALLAFCLVAAGCSPPPESIDLTGFLPVARTVVATPDLFPEGADRLVLGSSVRVRGEQDEAGPMLVVRGHRGVVGFPATALRDLELQLEIRQAPPDPAPARTLTLSVNGETLAETGIAKRWETLTLAVDRARLHNGINRLGFRLEAEPDDPVGEPIVAVRIRSLRVRAAELERAPWPSRPTSIEVTPSTEQSPGAIEVPVQATLELAVAPGPDTRLLGRLELVPARGQAARPLRARVTRVDSAMAAEVGGGPDVRTLAELEVGADGPTALDVDLGPLAGSVALLRLEVDGETNGSVRWRDLRLETDSDTAPVVVPGTPRTLEPVVRTGRYAGSDVVVVVLDAARADAYGAYGAERPTPRFDALAADSVLFEAAWTAAPWTAPSLTTLLTGLQSDAHAVEAWDRFLPRSIATLGERFEAAGYHTVIWTQHLLYETNPTLRRGFAEIHQLGPDDRSPLPSAEELFEPDRPGFALVHLLVPHSPYVAPQPYRDRYADPAGWSPEALAAADDPSTVSRFRRDWDRQEPPSELLELMRDRYDEMVAWSDTMVGGLVDTLRAAGRFEDTLVVVTGDHGEAFWEHGELLHTRSLYEEVLRVPLLIKLPGGASAGSQIARPVGLIDLVATLIDAAGLPEPERLSEYEATVGLQSRSLLELVLAPESDESATRPDDPSTVRLNAYATTRSANFRRQPGHRLLALRAGRFKVLVDTLWQRVELYDLEDDPHERRDLARGPARVLAAWLAQAALAQHSLNGILANAFAGTETTDGELDLEQLRTLESLGYIQ